MPGLVTFEHIGPDGKVEFSETVPYAETALESIEKTVKVLGVTHTVRLTFDPFVVPRPAPEKGGT